MGTLIPVSVVISFPNRRHVFLPLQSKFVADLEDNGAIDWTTVERKTTDQRVVTDHTDRPGNPARALVNQRDTLPSKQMGGNAAHRPDSVRDIGGRFRKLERAEDTAKGNTLFQLPQGRMFETIVEFRLRRQDQRQQFFIGRFDIAKESNFLQQLGREALRLIDNKCCDLANKADESFSCYPSIRTLMSESGAGSSTSGARSRLWRRSASTRHRQPQFHESGAQRSSRYYLPS